MHRDSLNLNFLLRSVLFVHLYNLHLCQCRQAIIPQDVTKDSILPIQMWSLLKAYEKLAAVRRRTLVGHADNSSSIMSQRGSNFVFERIFPYRVATLGLRGRSTSLDHEVRYESVKERAIVVARGTKCKEVLCCLWHSLAENFNLDVTEVRVQSNRHGEQHCVSNVASSLDMLW